MSENKHWLPKHPLQIGQRIMMAIAQDEDFYEEYIEKYTQYPDEEDDKYYDGTANYDDDVDIAEMYAIIAMLEYSITNHHPHKVGVAEE
jgi:hypothetical protein